MSDSRRHPGGNPGSGVSTGHPDDDEILRQIALQSPLQAPRHWRHFLYCQNETAARAAAAEIAAAGWEPEVIDESSEGYSWLVTAEQHGVIISADAIRKARVFFESLASRIPGGDYDGWEASV